MRKRQHIDIALSAEASPEKTAGFDLIDMVHEALPDIDFEHINLETQLFGRRFSSPVFVSSMTAGHSDSLKINSRLASACAKLNIPMGVGSQRRQLFDSQAQQEWEKIREAAPDCALLGNIGVAQLGDVEAIARLVESIQATAMIVHTNPLQEALQPEGTPKFRGGLENIKRLCASLEVPVILKETGCGFSQRTLKRLVGSGLYAVDISGFGGTHWGRVEGLRSHPGSVLNRAGETFGEWGISTVQSLLGASEIEKDFRIWASGGVRNGLHVAKSLALGAEMVGIAGPVMSRALMSEDAIVEFFDQIHTELRIAMFCSGIEAISEFNKRKVWQIASSN